MRKSRESYKRPEETDCWDEVNWATRELRQRVAGLLRDYVGQLTSKAVQQLIGDQQLCWQRLAQDVIDDWTALRESNESFHGWTNYATAQVFWWLTTNWRKHRTEHLVQQANQVQQAIEDHDPFNETPAAYLMHLLWQDIANDYPLSDPDGLYHDVLNGAFLSVDFEQISLTLLRHEQAEPSEFRTERPRHVEESDRPALHDQVIPSLLMLWQREVRDEDRPADVSSLIAACADCVDDVPADHPFSWLLAAFRNYRHERIGRFGYASELERLFNQIGSDPRYQL